MIPAGDRQLYCTDIDQDYDPDAPAERQFHRQCIKQYDEIKNNFMVANYHANRGAIDVSDVAFGATCCTGMLF